MSNNYGQDPPLSYNKYLRVQDLINLQDCLSDPAHHDELLFITVHQAYELWFKQILHELDAAISMLAQDRLPAATRAIKRVVEIEKLLLNQIHIMSCCLSATQSKPTTFVFVLNVRRRLCQREPRHSLISDF